MGALRKYIARQRVRNLNFKTHHSCRTLQACKSYIYNVSIAICFVIIAQSPLSAMPKFPSPRALSLERVQVEGLSARPFESDEGGETLSLTTMDRMIKL